MRPGPPDRATYRAHHGKRLEASWLKKALTLSTELERFTRFIVVLEMT